MNCPHCHKSISFKCLRCGHTWTPRKGEPKICPECKRKLKKATK